jgi:hypothetical protein
MRILFAVSHFGFLRNFEFALRELAGRGHQIHLSADRKESIGGERTMELLTAAHPGITAGFAPNPKRREWYAYSLMLRRSLDYLRYLDPRYDESPKLRGRAEAQVPGTVVTLAGSPPLRTAAGRRLMMSVFKGLERAAPVDRAVEIYLQKQRPDLLLNTPLLYFGSQQVEYVRAARALGIPTILGVGSWDHLTTKGLIHDIPDWVMVWNDAQRQEAGQLHGVPADRVIVTGAQAYDHWFTQTPASSREEFCAQVGLDAGRRIVLYLCSSPFITPREVPFILEWIAAIRGAASPDVAGASILIRPHPQNAAQWDEFDPSAFPNLAVWPKAGANPVDSAARAGYFDSMYHSDAVVGINTSGQIESGILGKPVMTVLVPAFAGTQGGTLHFRHLRDTAGGLLHVAPDLKAHTAQLAEVFAAPVPSAKSRAFVNFFVRPRGLDRPVAGVFADEVERIARLGAPAVAPAQPWQRPLRWAMQPAAALLRAMIAARPSEKGARG